MYDIVTHPVIPNIPSLLRTYRPSFIDKFVNDNDIAQIYSLNQFSLQTTDVIHVRRDSDNSIKSFNLLELKNGLLSSWTNEDINIYTSDFSSNSDGFNNVRTIVSGNIDSIDGENNCLSIEVNSTGNNSKRAYYDNILPLKPITISFRVYIPSTNTIVDGIKIEDFTTGFTQSFEPVLNTWTTYEVTGIPTSDRLEIYMLASGNDIFLDALANDLIYLKDIIITQNGLANGFIDTWYDQIVPTSKQAMYFDGIDDFVSADVGSYFADNSTQKYEFFLYSIEGNSMVLINVGTDNNNGIQILSQTSTELRVELKISSVTYSLRNIPVIQGIYSVEINTSSPSVLVTDPNGDQYTNNLSSSIISYRADGNLYIGKRPILDSNFLQGSISNVKLYDSSNELVHSYRGDGNYDENWIDLVGSSNGSVNGDPIRVSSQNLSTFPSDGIQNTEENQPLIVDAGQLITNNNSFYYTNAISNYLDLGNSSSVNAVDEFTAICIVKVNDTGSNKTILSKYDYSSNNERSWSLAVNSDEKIFLSFGDPNNGTFEGNYTSDDSILTTQYYIISAIYNAGNIKIYLNDTEITGSITSGTIPTSLYQVNEPLLIGARTSTTKTDFFVGDIGFVGLWLNDKSNEILNIVNSLNNNYNIF